MERDPRTRAEEQKTYCLLPNKPYDALRVKLQVEYKGYARRSQTKLQRKFFQLQLEGTEYIYSANRFTAEGQLSISSDAIGVEDDSPTFEEEEGMANDDSDEPGRMIATLSKALTERTFMNRERCASRVLIRMECCFLTKVVLFFNIRIHVHSYACVCINMHFIVFRMH